MASHKPHCAVQTPSTLCGLVNQIFALSATHDVGNQVNGCHRRCHALCATRLLFAFSATIDDQSTCDPDRFCLTPILSDRARISFTNPHEVDGVLLESGGIF